jgi:ATP-dependent Zn protease
MSYAMVSKYGMSDKIGYVGYVENEYSKSYSDATNKLIDDEIKSLIDLASDKTRELVKKHRSEIEKLSSLLLEKETLDLK